MFFVDEPFFELMPKQLCSKLTPKDMCPKPKKREANLSSPPWCHVIFTTIITQPIPLPQHGDWALDTQSKHRGWLIGIV